MTTHPPAGVARLVRRAADPADVPDGRLLDRFARHADQDAFALLVRRHGPMVLGVGRRVLGNAADADDAFQAAFLVLARKSAELAARPAVGNWLYGVAVHVARKAKAMAAKRRAKEATAARPDRAPPADDPDWRSAFDRELAALPDKYREPLVLHELEGLPRKAVAARLGIPDGTLSSRLTTAKRLLAARLARAGLPAAALAALGGAGQATVPPGLLAAAIDAAGGGATNEIQNLAREVSVMLLVKKLTVGTALGLAAAAIGLTALAADPPASGESPPKAPPVLVKPVVTVDPLPSAWVADPVYKKMRKEEEDADAALRGKWVLESRAIGVPVPPGAMISGGPSVLTFADRRVTLAGGKKGWYTINPRTDPPELNLYGDNFLMLCRYRVEGDQLWISYFGRSEVERPAELVRAKSIAAHPLRVDAFRRAKEAKTPKAVLEQFQGTWEVVSALDDGKDLVQEADLRWAVVDGDRWQIGAAPPHAIRLDPTGEPNRVPRAVDFVWTSPSGGQEVTPGIFAFGDDTLTLCVGRAGGPRPRVFTAPAGSKRALLELKRKK
jgi:RNA polymerase sigma factor (sigma-70 family)